MRTTQKKHAMNLVFCLAFVLAPLVAASGSMAQPAAPDTSPGQTGPGSAAPSPTHLAAARALVVACGMSRSFSSIIPQFMDQIGSSLTQTRPELSHDLNAVLTGLKPEFDKQADEMVDIAAQIYVKQMSEPGFEVGGGLLREPGGKKIRRDATGLLDRGRDRDARLARQDIDRHDDPRARGNEEERPRDLTAI